METIYAKTAKGVRETTGKTRSLAREYRDVLRAIEGQVTVGELLKKTEGWSEDGLRKALGVLIADGYVRASLPAPPPESQQMADLDFTSLPAEEAARREAEERAKREAAEQAQREAEEQVRKLAREVVRRETRERAKREAAEQAQRDAEERARRLAEEASRREAEERARREAAEKARGEAEAQSKRLTEEARRREQAERLKREEAERARRDAEEAAKRLAEEAARREAEERARREAAEQARQEAEAQARRQAEEAVRRENEERAKREAAEQARFQAEAQARRLAEEAAKREAEERTKREAAEQARREAEEAARRLAEEAARREEADRARLAAEENARRLAEEASRREAEERARREAAEEAQRRAEETARREAEASARQRADEAAKREAEEAAKQAERREAERREAEQREAERREAERRETAQREAERQETADRMQREAEARQRARAEEEERRKREDQARRAEAKEEARRVAEERAARKAAERARRAAEKQREQQAVRALPRPRARAAKAALLGLLASVGAGIALLHVVAFDSRIPVFEQAIAARLQQPARIKSVRFALLPRPHWRLSDIAIGDAGQIRAPHVDAFTSPLAWLQDRGGIDGIEAEAPTLTGEGLRWLLFAAPVDAGARIAHAGARGAKLEAGLALPELDADAEIGADGRVQTMTAASGDGKFKIALGRSGDGFDVRIDAASLATPFAGVPALQPFTAKGSARAGALEFAEFEGGVLGGTLNGQARLAWDGTATLGGEFVARRLDAARLLPGLLAAGTLEGKAAFSAPLPGGESQRARLQGSFLIRDGAFATVDLARVLSGGGAGRMPFAALEGNIAHDAGATRLRQLRLDAGALTARGSADIGADGGLQGTVAIELTLPAEKRRGEFTVSGGPAAKRGQGIAWKRR